MHRWQRHNPQVIGATNILSTSPPDEVYQSKRRNQNTIDQPDSYILGEMIKFKFSIKKQNFV